MTTMTKRDAISAAMGLAEDVAEGRLNPAALADRAAVECQRLFGTVREDSPVWQLQVAVAREVVALGGVPADELAEWSAVFRRRAGQPTGEPEHPAVEDADDDEQLTVPDELYDQVRALVENYHREHPREDD